MDFNEENTQGRYKDVTLWRHILWHFSRLFFGFLDFLRFMDFLRFFVFFLGFLEFLDFLRFMDNFSSIYG